MFCWKCSSCCRYFQKLVENFNQQMKLYKDQIEELEQHFASLSSVSKFTPEGIQPLACHQTFYLGIAVKKKQWNFSRVSLCTLECVGPLNTSISINSQCFDKEMNAKILCWNVGSSRILCSTTVGQFEFPFCLLYTSLLFSISISVSAAIACKTLA